MEAELKTHRKTLSDFNLPRPPPPRPPAGHPTRQRCRPFYAVGTGINRPSAGAPPLAAAGAPAVAGENGRFFFLDAMGGCGKTFVLSLLLNTVRMDGGIAVACASSGLAALLLEGGAAAQNRFKLPLEIDEQSVSMMTARSGEAAVLRVLLRV
eukprot:1194619-Prorocentrum_minimum.AAC.2